jgi:hypothetical protein
VTASVQSGAELVDVRLLRFPLSLHAASEEHHDELLREFAHIANAEDGSARVPQRLLSLVASLRERYAPFSGPVQEQIERARERGEDTIDLTYRVPASVGTAALELAAMLDEADDFCRRGHLLTLAADGPMAAFRRWLLEEFAHQVDGGSPRPWPPDTGHPASRD